MESEAPDSLAIMAKSMVSDFSGRYRRGAILSGGMVLKQDYFPEGETDLALNITGAPNFRQSPLSHLLPMYGVGQPTVSGMRTMLNFMHAHRSTEQQVLWINLREEPVVFINSRAFVLRDIDSPFQNLADFEGIDAKRLDAIERRLKADILAEASNNYNNILVHDEKHGLLRPCWESATKHCVQTTQEVVEQLQQEGYRLKFHRIPVTAESSLSPNQVDELLTIILEAPRDDPHTAFIFNCQMGRGRSTLGMIYGLLMCHALDMRIPLSVDSSRVPTPLEGERHHGKQGDYDIILKLLRRLRFGRKAKEQCDLAISSLGQVYNLLGKILHLVLKCEQSRDEETQQALFLEAATALQRYFNLICFQEYLEECCATGTFERKHNFETWLLQHPELTMMFKQFKAGTSTGFLRAQVSTSKLSPTDIIVSSRKGNVLGRHTIIMFEDNLLPRARQDTYQRLQSLPVASTAQPRQRSIATILGDIATEEKSEDNHQCKRVIWINLREEPVLYIKGRPCVLRDIRHPLRTLAEFLSGMTPRQAQELEDRLKSDVLAELKRFDGKLLVHEPEPGSDQVSAQWVSLRPSDIHTCRETYSQLSSSLQVSYFRIPIQIKNVLSLRSLDYLFRVLNNTEDGTFYVFNCQRGERRSAVGMVFTCLTLMHRNNNMVLPSPSQAMSMRTGLRAVKSMSDMSRLALGGDEGISVASRASSGEFSGILALVRILKQGAQMKRKVDDVIDLCGRLHNLREVICRAHLESFAERKKSNQNLHIRTALKYLASYGYLICYSAYLNELNALRSSVITEMVEEEDKRPCKSQCQSNLAQELGEPSDDEDDLGSDESSNQVLRRPVLVRSATETQLGLGVDTRETTFRRWVRHRPELVQILEDLHSEGSLRVDMVSGDKNADVHDRRNGQVFVRSSILKSDFFLGHANNRIPQYITDAHNFRYLGDDTRFYVAGVAIPTSEGISRVLHYLSPDHKYFQSDGSSAKLLAPASPSTSVIWFNFREEPFLFINGNPYCLRNIDKPNDNLEYTGIVQKRLEALEKQLKRDVIAEAVFHGNRILLHLEDQTGQTKSHWEPITDVSVQTPLEAFGLVFRNMSASVVTGTPSAGFRAVYHRTPITDERAPQPSAIDTLLSLFEANSHMKDRAFIFNCQMGRGRTTTGMIIACLWSTHRFGSPQAPENSQKQAEAKENKIESKEQKKVESKEKKKKLQSPHAQQTHHAKRLRAGWWKIVQKLVRVLPDGVAVKQQTDRIIDICGLMQNLREATYELQERSQDALPSRRAFIKHRGEAYLERYFYLIVLNAYLSQTIPHKQDATALSFVSWLAQRSEVVNLLDGLVFPELVSQ